LYSNLDRLDVIQATDQLVIPERELCHIRKQFGSLGWLHKMRQRNVNLNVS